MNALQWAGVVAAIVALIACVLAVVAPKDSEQRAVLSVYALITVLCACVFAAFGLAKQTQLID